MSKMEVHLKLRSYRRSLKNKIRNCIKREHNIQSKTGTQTHPGPYYLVTGKMSFPPGLMIVAYFHQKDEIQPWDKESCSVFTEGTGSKVDPPSSRLKYVNFDKIFLYFLIRSLPSKTHLGIYHAWGMFTQMSCLLRCKPSLTDNQLLMKKGKFSGNTVMMFYYINHIYKCLHSPVMKTFNYIQEKVTHTGFHLSTPPWTHQRIAMDFN